VGVGPHAHQVKMTRKLVIGSLLIVALAAAGVLWLRNRGAASNASGGPIVIFSIDTLRADHLPAYGYNGIATPNIDAFARDAVIFDNAYSHSPQTLPAHTSILSGRLPFEHGVRDNIGFAAKAGEPFLQRRLKDAGYATAAFVSAYVLRKDTGLNQGFDVYDDALPPAAPDRPLGQLQRPGERTVDAATRWLDGQPNARAFLFVHIYEPHKPYAPPPRFTAANPYDGEIEYSDEIFGRLLDHLRSKRLYDRATIVLLSDHGEGLGDHGEEEHGIFLYRETTRVVLMIKRPGAGGGGRHVAAPVQHIDIVPTILDGAPDLDGPPEGGPYDRLKGRSLRSVLDRSGTLAGASIYSEALSPRYHFGWSELYALTEDRFRLIRAPRDELYDIEHDPRELTSLAAERPQARTAMRRALDAMIANTSVTAPSAVSEDDRRRLAALGYVGTQSGASLSLPGDRLPDPKDKIGILKQYREATELARTGRPAEAETLFRRLLREEPDMLDAWLQLADVYRRRAMTADMVNAYREVIARSPKNLAALMGIAGGLLRLGRLDDARAHAQMAIDLAPAAAHETLARIAIERGDAEGARREARLAHDADPTLPAPAYVEGVLLHRQRQFAAALPRLLEARDALAGRAEQIPDVNFLAGDAAAQLGRYDEAERLFRAELAAFPSHVRARAGLAMLYRASGRDADSDRAVADLIRDVPTREGYDVAAQLWTMFGQPGKAAAIRAEARRFPG
jgi:choline-sulfatase